MSQSVIGLLLFFSLNTFAASPKRINELYSEFTRQKDALLTSDLTRQNIKEKVTTTYADLEKKLKEVTEIESTLKGDQETPEGNTMAYELSFLETLKDFATGLLNKEECEKAAHENELNNPIIEENDGKAIGDIITKICSP